MNESDSDSSSSGDEGLYMEFNSSDEEGGELESVTTKTTN